MDGATQHRVKQQLDLVSQARGAGQRYANESMYREARGVVCSTRAWDRFLDWSYDELPEGMPLAIDASGLDAQLHAVWEAFREEFDGYFGRE